MSDEPIDLGGINNGASGNDSGGDAGANGGAEPAPKRRGRPRGSANGSGGGIVTIDPTTLGSGDSGPGDGDGGSGDGPKRRGRKPGSSKAKKVPVSVDALIILLSTMQLGAFKLTEVPEVILDADQNKNLAEALANVTRHYPMVISEKMQDIVALGFVSANIAGMQMMKYSQRTAAQKQG